MKIDARLPARATGGQGRGGLGLRLERWTRVTVWLLCAGWAGRLDAAEAVVSSATGPGLTYTNYTMADVPWSVHVVRVDRRESPFQVWTVHADDGALGLSPLTKQVGQTQARGAVPVAAINGDFYQRARAYVGDPRGLQIVNGEAISAPTGGVAFWVDAAGEFHATNVAPRCEVVWPGGERTPFGLNAERPADGAQLYTPALGASTRTTGGRELVLERAGAGPWLPLRMGVSVVARVREVREGGDTPLAADRLVLSLGPTCRAPRTGEGAEVRLVVDSTPSLAGASAALGGGPLLVSGGWRQPIVPPPVEAYEFTSMRERHPRSAIGWNATTLFLVQVDGRQKGVSVGMTLEELSAYLVTLGCREAMNLDGGGSATLWYEGRVRNRPCDGYERPIANAVVVVRTNGVTVTAGAGAR